MDKLYWNNMDRVLFLRKNIPKAGTWINPVNQGINHSPPYLLGVTQLQSNKYISEEVERKKEHDPA